MLALTRSSSPTAITANAQEFNGQEKWQGSAKQGRCSAARAKEAAQHLHAGPRVKSEKGEGGGGVLKARSGGTTADESTIEEFKSLLREQRAAAPLHNGWN